MSGSPTWAEIQLQREQERRLAEERRRRAEEERRRREEAERRAREELRVRLVGEIEQEVGAARRLLSELRASPSATRSPGGVPHLEHTLDAFLAMRHTSPESAAGSLVELRGITAPLRRHRDAIGRAARALEASQDELRAEAAAEAERQQREAAAHERSLAAEDATHTESLARNVSLQREQALAEIRRSAEAASARAAIEVRLAGFAADEVTTTWAGDEIAAVRSALDDLERAPSVTAAVRALNERFDRALERAQARQLLEERRAYIVHALQSGLRAQGFQVGEPSLVGASLDGEVAFRAVRPDRRFVDVSVPVEGSIIYEVDGTDRVVERSSDGAVHTRCDETEARLIALHEDIEARFGVTAGEVLWEQKDPLRKQRRANELPGDRPGHERRKR